MENNVTWQENHKFTISLVWKALLAAIVAFVAADVMHPVGITELLRNNSGTIGFVIFGLSCFGCFFEKKKLEKEDVSIMTFTERKIHKQSLHKIRGLTILLFNLFAVSFAIDSFFDKPINSDNIASIMLAMFGALMIGSAIFAGHMAKQIKLKHTNK